jgi:hypothetical protein
MRRGSDNPFPREEKAGDGAICIIAYDLKPVALAV